MADDDISIKEDGAIVSVGDEETEVLLDALGFEVTDEGVILDSMGVPVECEYCETEITMDNYGFILPADKEASNTAFLCDDTICHQTAVLRNDNLAKVLKD